MGGHADTIVSLFAGDGSTLLDENDDDPDEWPASRLVWQAPASGLYYVRIQHWDFWAFGCTTTYDFAVRAMASDTTQPSVAWIGPATDGQVYSVTGQTVLLHASATDNLQVSRVHFYRWDGVAETWVQIGDAYEPPYQFTLDASGLNRGWNQVNVTAIDLAGNYAAHDPYIWLDMQQRLIYLPLVVR